MCLEALRILIPALGFLLGFELLGAVHWCPTLSRFVSSQRPLCEQPGDVLLDKRGVYLDTPYRFISAPGRNRTGDLALRRHSLYPLSYRGRKCRPESDNRPLLMVEEKGIEPSTFALRTRRSPN